MYSATPPAHVSLASPPSTPLMHHHGGPFPSYHAAAAAAPPPMSAPPQFTNFPDFSSQSTAMGLSNWPEVIVDEATTVDLSPGKGGLPESAEEDHYDPGFSWSYGYC